ncbi:restriction endonuclease subunit S [Tenacibaculum finnmarkense]|uniref:restriction endonuclease subunit S n=1 Tax=Tenacibaculum finnmarkense TaxID=2781243 RepID=UPI00187B9B89|nr:restriction endonuclease subunit S [Tenacibaculum finnmarkense]MBE7633875.1 restriction endonuclease subunit S [Tenacibaculum finnmarkense genomovar ulcerans]MBE7647819.1 restriction endonuclease subunit S [Tenacibaculum finnmarkense genomovar ulcerans]MCG8795496.1 restriction endonuclease subunit S [Tenacibaculum finnmarkense]MCG8797726.1 restriction endonuclease subunit S [Tenacibaculum finnmarkense]MCG8812839.1 restriction endonuclease subunit S [Tenacibaculum finnmarkense]
MEKYKKYKNSGIDWLGEIPEHWEVSHIKRICRKITDGAHTSPDLSSPDYPFLSVVNLKNGKLDFVKCHYTSTTDYKYLLRNGCKPFKNDILFSKDGTIGESIVITKDIDFVVGSSFIITRPNKNIISSYYFQYFLSSPLIKDTARVFVKGTGIPRLSIFNFSRLNTLIPPIKEQTEIANYLDSKTQTIDKKVKLLSEKISTYKDYRKTLINQTVTKGLDKNVKLKNSGINWIGEIPKHWEVKRLKDLYKSSMGNTILKEDLEKDGKIPVYSATEKDKFFGFVNKARLILKPNDLVTPARGNSIGFVKIVKVKSTTTQTTIASKKKIKINSTFVFYFLQGNKSVIFKFDDTAIPQFTVEDMNLINIVIPNDLKEQQEIANYLDDKTQTIDTIIKNIENQITTLKELRKTLINEVVTGNVKITE